MSDTDNKTEKNTETKTADVAPYMKKAKQDDNNKTQEKTNMLIPAVLILVSAIVIGTTFYNKEDKELLVQTDIPITAVTEVVTIVETPANDITATQPPVTNTETSAEENTVQVDTTEKITVAESNETPIITKSPVISTEKVAAVTTKQSSTAGNNMPAQPANTRYQYNQPYPQMAQARTKQHMEMLQQHRQAYESAMQDRRARYETAINARQEKQAKVAAAKKAVYQRIQKDRLAADQKIQQIHKQIAKLHEEIHQIMRESRRNATPVKMHSM